MIQRIKDKPRPTTSTTGWAAVYDGSMQSVDDIRAIARKHDPDAEAERLFNRVFDLVLVRSRDERGNADYDVVERDHFLVYSETFGLLFSSDPRSFEREHKVIG